MYMYSSYWGSTSALCRQQRAEPGATAGQRQARGAARYPGASGAHYAKNCPACADVAVFEVAFFSAPAGCLPAMPADHVHSCMA